MKKNILLGAAFLMLATAIQAQPPVVEGEKATLAIPGRAATQGYQPIANKADSLMAVAATKLGVDTNASAEQIGAEIDTAISFVPGKHAGYLAWLKFLMKLFIPIVAIYFFIKHQIVSAKLKSLTKVALIMVAVGSGFGVHAQTINSARVNKYYHRPVVVKQLQKHSIQAHGSTKALLTAISVTNLPTTGTIIYSTPSVGIGALTVQKSNLSGWETAGTITPSFSYSVGCGQYTTNADGSLNIEPYVSLGAFVAAGVIPQSVVTGSVQLGGALNVYKYNSLAVGYDAVTKKPFFAIGASVSLFTFKQGLGSSILHLF